MDIRTYIAINDTIKKAKLFPQISVDEMYVYDAAIKSYESLLNALNLDVIVSKYVVDISRDLSVMALFVQNKKVQNMYESYLLKKSDNCIEFLSNKSELTSEVDLIEESEIISKDVSKNIDFAKKIFSKLLSENEFVNSQVEDNDIVVPDYTAIKSVFDDNETGTQINDTETLYDNLAVAVKYIITSDIETSQENELRGYIEITDDSIFSLVKENYTDEDYDKIFKTNKVLEKINTDFIFELDKKKFVTAYLVLVRGINKSEAELVNPDTILKDDEYFLMDIIDNKAITLAYDTVDSKFIAKSFTDINSKEPIVCIPNIPSNVDETVYHICDIPMAEDNRYGVFLVEEGYISSLHRYNRMKYMYSEASLQQTAIDLVRKLKELPSELYDKYKEIQQNIKTVLRDYKKAEDDKLREEIIMDEYIPELKKLMNFLKGLSGGYLLVFTGLATPLVGVLAGGIIFMLDKMNDDKKRQRALSFIRNEINMQEEKISDARANGDTKAKYELIRFTHALNEKLDKYIEN